MAAGRGKRRVRTRSGLKPGLTAIRRCKRDAVFDLGQNAAHVPKISVAGPAGSKVRLLPSELLDGDGAINQGSMGAGRRGALWCEFTKATDDVETWSPKFFYVGCRYVQAHFIPAVTNGALPKIKSLA